MEKNRIVRSAVMVMTMTAIMAAALVGCGGQKYHVDYHGQESLFKGAKSSYSAGAKVKLKYDMIATDTDYYFYVGGENYNASWDGNGYVISFEMPAHDIEVYCEQHNSMVNMMVLESK